MGKGMKNFTYYDDDKRGLFIFDCDWLRDTGLKETRWILDSKWLLANWTNLTFKKLIGE